MERCCGRLLRRSLAATAAATDGGGNASLFSTYRQFLSHGSLSSQIRQSRPFPFRESAPSKYLSAPSDCPPAGLGLCNLLVSPFQFLGKTNRHWGSNSRADWMNKGLSRSEGIFDQFICHSRQCMRVASLHDPSQLSKVYARHAMLPSSIRALSSTSSSHSSERTTREESRKDLTTSEDPFDAPTYNIPEKPVTFTEGASYSVVILLGLGIAAAAAYAVFKELIFEPKEYKIFGKALERVQNDSQVRVRIGSPVTGYGQESRNRAARQRIPHKTWTDEDGVEHVEVSFFVRGPHGAGRVYSEMFRHKDDKQWKFTYLIVDIMSPSQSRLMLESYIPA